MDCDCWVMAPFKKMSQRPSSPLVQAVHNKTNSFKVQERFIYFSKFVQLRNLPNIPFF